MRPICFATESYEPLMQDIALVLRADIGAVERRAFPDGERYLRILGAVFSRSAVIVGGTVDDRETLELYDLASGLVQQGVRRLTLVIPFFGYGTMERVSKAGEVVKAKTRARLFSSIPVPDAGCQVILLDLHAEGITFYFEGNLTPVHLSAAPLVGRLARELGGEKLVLAATDAGRAKWVERLANAIGAPAAFVYKRRHDDGTTEVTAVNAQVRGRHVVIYDDMIRSGGSLLGAARTYKAAGAEKIWALATHGLFPGDALHRLRESGILEGIVCTDSHPRARLLAPGSGGFLRVESVASILAARAAVPEEAPGGHSAQFGQF